MNIAQMFLTFLLIFFGLTILYNISPKWPRFPWDFDLSKVHIYIYLPIITSLILSVVVTILFKMTFGF